MYLGNISQLANLNRKRFRSEHYSFPAINIYSTRKFVYQISFQASELFAFYYDRRLDDANLLGRYLCCTNNKSEQKAQIVKICIHCTFRPREASSSRSRPRVRSLAEPERGNHDWNINRMENYALKSELLQVMSPIMLHTCPFHIEIKVAAF